MNEEIGLVWFGNRDFLDGVYFSFFSLFVWLFGFLLLLFTTRALDEDASSYSTIYLYMCYSICYRMVARW